MKKPNNDSPLFREAVANFWDKLRLGNPDKTDSEIRAYLDREGNSPSYFEILPNGGLKLRETIHTKIVSVGKTIKTAQLSLF